MMTIPAFDEIEVTLIGTGGGYGESVVVHLGNQHWIVVDSCINPETKNPLPLEYLESIGVNVAKDVKLVLCTHWHDDHIQGLSQILEAAESAIFSVTETGDREKFLQFIQIDYQKVRDIKETSSTKELNQCLDLVVKRNTSVKSAVQDKILLSDKPSDKMRYAVISLSPSDLVVEEYKRELGLLMDQYGQQNRKVVINSPNDKSVVLYIEVGTVNILLGSDLEVSNSTQKGWKCILTNSQSITGKASYSRFVFLTS